MSMLACVSTRFQQVVRCGYRGAAVLAVFAVSTVMAGCVCTPGSEGYGVSISVPALPPVVVLDLEPFLFHSGFYFFYQGDRWAYSDSRSGPWRELPRDRYPREIRYRGRDNDSRGGGGIERR
jgi:hypothetical protein